jgi:acyl transferase domain-containing protein
VAACLAGVFSLEDALALVAARGKLMQSAPRGAMLAVGLAESELDSHLTSSVSVAAVNGPTQSVVSGPAEAIDDLERELTQRGVPAQRLRTSHAFHSWMLESVAADFAARVASVDMHEPRMPFVSNVTGTWITPDEATSPVYWAAQLRQTVRFADGLQTLVDGSIQALLEVGPGAALSGLARGQLGRSQPAPRIVSSLRRDRELRSMLEALGTLWVTGAEVDWTVLQAEQPGRRVPLPTYAFERRRYWVDAPRRGERAAIAPTVVVEPEPAFDTATVPAEDFVAPRNDTERIVAGVWQDLLGIDRVGIHDDFLELGGTSLLATQVAARLRQAFDVELPLRQFLEAPTVEGLSLAIGRERLERSDTDVVARLVGEIAALTPDEVAQLLGSGSGEPQTRSGLAA